MEPGLCQFYRRTFVPYLLRHIRSRLAYTVARLSLHYTTHNETPQEGVNPPYRDNTVWPAPLRCAETGAAKRSGQRILLVVVYLGGATF